MMNKLSKRYFSTTFFIALFLFLTTAYLVLVFINYNANKSMMEDLAKTNQINIVKGYKRQIDEWLAVKKRIVSSLAQLLCQLDPNKDKDRIKQYLQNTIAYGEFRSVYVGYENEHFITGINWQAPADYFPTQRPWYSVGKQKNDTAITLPYIDSDLLEDVISIVSPVYRDKQLMGVLSSDLILDSIQKEILSINLPFNGFAFLVSKNGHILVSPYGFSEHKCHGCEPAISAILANQQESGDTTYLFDHKKYLVFYEPLQNSDWIFATVLDEESIFGNLDDQLFQNVIMALGFNLFGMLAVLAFLFLSRKIFEHKRLLDTFANGNTQAIAIVDKKKNIILVNKPFEHLLMLENTLELPLSLESLKAKKGNTPLIYLIIQSLEDVIDRVFQPKLIKIPDEQRQQCFLLHIMPIVENNTKIEGIILSISDITHEYRLEVHSKEQEQIMIQHSKMAAMGEMVGAITHQWRQPLASLLILMGMLRLQVKEQLMSEEKLLESFDKVIEITNFMEQTLQSFKSFYKMAQEKEYFDTATIIEEVVSIMRPISRIHNSDIHFEYDYTKDFPLVSYPNYLKQILVNLISNAKDAIIEKNNTNAEGHIVIRLKESLTHYLIMVEDDGVGIREDFKERLFKAMQTTKGAKGTGNGLYLCKLLVENKLGGTITLEQISFPTVFIISLPKGDTKHHG